MSNSPPKLAENNRNLSDDEESVQEVVIKRVKPKLNLQAKPDVDLTKEAIGFRSDSPGLQGEEGLYDPHEDLWVQFHTDGIEDRTKRLLFLRELDIETLRYHRNEAYHKLRALEEGFLTSSIHFLRC